MRLLGRFLPGNDRGGAAVEFAIAAPFLFTLILGSIDMGRMFYVRQGLEYATEQAARYYMLNPSSASSAVTTYLQSQMPGGMGSSVSVSYTDTTNCNSMTSVTCTQIQATYSFSFIAQYLGLGTKTLKATAQAVRAT
ncbi:MAG TPA: TadE/TadG family type IV pilus assembly protein [Reyranella sp.]|jgi:Flp pilus assembly protein TadG|nr:TadE/TadG family type IV pilus assembly protein [Reyranella sp.]